MYINETELSPGPTFAQHLGAAGYAVGMFGKYLNLSPRSGEDTPEPWSTGPTNNYPVSAPSGVHTYFVSHCSSTLVIFEIQFSRSDLCVVYLC